MQTDCIYKDRSSHCIDKLLALVVLRLSTQRQELRHILFVFRLQWAHNVGQALQQESIIQTCRGMQQESEHIRESIEAATASTPTMLLALIVLRLSAPRQNLRQALFLVCSKH